MAEEPAMNEIVHMPTDEAHEEARRNPGGWVYKIEGDYGPVCWSSEFVVGFCTAVLAPELTECHDGKVMRLRRAKVAQSSADFVKTSSSALKRHARKMLAAAQEIDFQCPG
jgi:hypothetical protein